MSEFFDRINPIKRIYNAGYDSGYNAALDSMENAHVIWQDKFRGLINKPETIRVWKQRHIGWWSYATTHLNLYQIPYNANEHKAYLELFSELEDIDGNL